jgi:type II secretory ATPase GspE/PulE/Tfp pilus assembly ATPase PilB-like protein
MDELVKHGTLTEILFRSQMVTEVDVRRALDEQRRTGNRMGELFVDLGIVTQEDIDWALSNHLDIPLVKLDRRAIDPDAVRCVPAEMARRHGLIPLLRVGDELSVAMIDPLDRDAVRELETATGCAVTVSISRAREVREMQELFYGNEAGRSFGLETTICPRAALAAVNADPSGARCLDLLLDKLVGEGWDALVGQPGEERALLQSRNSGVLREVGKLPLESYAILVAHFRRLGAIEAAAPAQRGLFDLSVAGRDQRFQALFLKALNGDCLTVTRETLSAFPGTLEGFRCPQRARDEFVSLAASRRGLVLFCGQDEEERGRLVELFLSAVDRTGRNVMLFGGALGHGGGRFPRIPTDGRSGGESQALLAAAIEHEPDVIAIDDVSDGRLFVAAGKAAMRGKLVLAGLPFDDREMLFRQLAVLWRRHAFVPNQLRGIVACRGVLTLCPACRREHEPEPDMLTALPLPAPPARLHRADGCPACNHTGHGEKKWLLDVVPVTRTLLDVFESSPDGEDAARYLRGAGQGGLEEEGRRMLVEGEISLDEYLASFVL